MPPCNRRGDRRIGAVQHRRAGLRQHGEARRPVVLACPAFRVDRAAHACGDVGRAPAIRLERIGGVDRQPRHQHLAHLGGALRQCFNLRPRRLGVHVIRRHRRHAAPVVDARVDQFLVDARRQVRRRLHVHIIRQDQPRRGDAPQQIVEVRFRRRRALGVRLGAEVLHDHFLDVAVARMQIADREQRLQPLRARFADADQYAGGERHRQFAGDAHHLQPYRGRLVRRAVMHTTRLAQTIAAQLQHDAHAGRHLAQRRDLVARHHAGIDVRQQPGLLQHQRAHLAQVLNRRVVPQRRQCLARGAIAQFRLVAQGEQRLGAARRGAGAGDRQHCLRRQIRRPPRARPLGERAVVTHVAAQLGQRDEHFSRIRHQAPMRGVASCRRLRHQVERSGSVHRCRSSCLAYHFFPEALDHLQRLLDRRALQIQDRVPRAGFLQRGGVRQHVRSSCR